MTRKLVSLVLCAVLMCAAIPALDQKAVFQGFIEGIASPFLPARLAVAESAVGVCG